MTTIAHKRGDTLSLGLTWDEEGETIDLTGYEVAAQLRDAHDVLVADLTVAIADQTTQRGRCTLSATAAETATWPIGKLSCDVQFTAPGGAVASSETFSISVARDITR